MFARRLLFSSLPLCFVASLLNAQLPPVSSDPLRPGQGTQGAAGCSATEASSCAQATGTELAQADG
jgi:hypothetical protein